MTNFSFFEEDGHAEGGSDERLKPVDDPRMLRRSTSLTSTSLCTDSKSSSSAASSSSSSAMSAATIEPLVACCVSDEVDAEELADDEVEEDDENAAYEGDKPSGDEHAEGVCRSASTTAMGMSWMSGKF